MRSAKVIAKAFRAGVRRGSAMPRTGPRESDVVELGPVVLGVGPQLVAVGDVEQPEGAIGDAVLPG
jgi:hypothetical protein